MYKVGDRVVWTYYGETTSGTLTKQWNDRAWTMIDDTDVYHSVFESEISLLA